MREISYNNKEKDLFYFYGANSVKSVKDDTTSLRIMAVSRLHDNEFERSLPFYSDDIYFKEEITWISCEGNIVINNKNKNEFTGYYILDQKEYDIRCYSTIVTEEYIDPEEIERTEERVEHLGNLDLKSIKKMMSLKAEEQSTELHKSVRDSVLEIVVVADCSYCALFENREEASRELKKSFDIVNTVFEKQIGITFSYEKFIVYDDCESWNNVKGTSKEWMAGCHPDLTNEARLNSFSLWRAEQNSQYGLYHLVSGCKDRCAGWAWISMVCQTKTIHLSNGDVKSGTSMTSKTKNHPYNIAHEIAHNLGAPHDCTSKECQEGYRICTECDNCDCKGKYIMDPHSVTGREFSKGTVEFLKNTIYSTAGSCLISKRARKFSLCGNGIKEEGEECDCGDDESCKVSKCCLPGCKLKPGAECSDDNDACCKNCRFIPKSEKKICRKAEGMCEEDTFCQGKTGECPIVFKPDGINCEYTELDGSKCIGGLCTSKKRECRLVFSDRESVDECSNRYYPDCKMRCSVPNEGCQVFDRYWPNGMPCYLNGRCYNGKCELTFKGVMKTKEGIIGVLMIGVISFLVIFFLRRGRTG
eukprot:GHVP01070001.1.p1 GENE.GHVP01070001.1~~GHVP01070001.1.p1  ORF type:complete len:607 (+),score=80.65 GHVP01070001.1:61-1821(+)